MYELLGFNVSHQLAGPSDRAFERIMDLDIYQRLTLSNIATFPVTVN